MITIRYLVSDVQASVDFYTKQLGFELVEQYGPAMAIVRQGDATMWLAGPPSSAARAMPDGRKPEPGGWNRMVLPVKDLPALVTKLKATGTKFRNDIVKGPGGSQILCEDPSGNVIELFQPQG
jgi:catechol 2,3-dioxygenase-like lactoylglutathione lyase family enzyme